MINFEKLKKHCLIAAIIKSAVAGVSAGLLVAGVFLLSFGLSSVEFHWAFSVLIGVVIAVLTGGLCFLLMRPTDKRVAKKYDNEYSLNEKLQTMVAFSGQEGEILTLQREDTAEKLAGISYRHFDISRVWYYIVLAVLAVAMFFTGIFVPASAQTDTPPIDIVDPEYPVEDNLFEYDLYMQASMAELIRNVRESDLSEQPKSEIVSVLETLDLNLGTISEKSVMQSTVISAIARIDGIIEDINSFRKISGVLERTQPKLSESILAGVAVYTSSNSLSEIERVKAFVSGMNDLIDIVLETRVDPLCESLQIPQSGVVDEESGKTVKLEDVLLPFIADLNSCLSPLEGMQDDGLFIALDKLSKDLSATAGKLGNYSDSVIHNEISTAFNTLKVSLNGSLGEQCYNCVMNTYIRQKLASIFGIALNSLPDFNNDLKDIGNSSGGNENPDDPNQGGSNSGGFGDKDVIYGSNDLIYDPDKEDWVFFGDVLNDYYQKFSDAQFDGTLSEDIVKLIEDYYKILYGGIQSDEQ